MDVFLYSASINRANASLFSEQVSKIENRRSSAGILLTTTGGDPDAAFLIAKCLLRHYPKTRFTAYIFGSCKSAGTLICVGAGKLVMADNGEIGPLDIQLGKDDELFKRSSGLDLTEATNHLRELSWDLFKAYFLDLKRGTSITTKTAAEIAQGLAVGIVSPIAAQIDPLRLGEIQRAMRITRDYGRLLNPTMDTLDLLIASYPSHGFVIDREQAGKLFKNVSAPTHAELALGALVNYIVAEERGVVTVLSNPADIKPNESHPVHPNGEPAAEGATSRVA
jgi:hypothetical protein